MFKKGFRFTVVKNGIVGVVGGWSSQFANETVYSVSFYENGRHYATYMVHESTIECNLRLGIYREEVE